MSVLYIMSSRMSPNLHKVGISLFAYTRASQVRGERNDPTVEVAWQIDVPVYLREGLEAVVHYYLYMLGFVKAGQAHYGEWFTGELEDIKEVVLYALHAAHIDLVNCLGGTEVDQIRFEEKYGSRIEQHFLEMKEKSQFYEEQEREIRARKAKHEAAKRLRDEMMAAILNACRKSPEPLSKAELAHVCGCDYKNKINSAIYRLIKEGKIARVRSRDRRSICYTVVSQSI